MSPKLTRIDIGGPTKPGVTEISKEMIINSDFKQLCDTIKIVVAIVGIVVIEIMNIGAGNDGVLIGGTIGVIAALGGYQVAKKKFQPCT